MNRTKSLSILNLFSFLLNVGLAYATQIKLINTLDVGEISGRYPSLFTPSDGTFSIWGVIYTALAIFCLYHIIIAYKHDPTHASNNDLSHIGWLFVLNNLATAGWLIAWTNNHMAISLLLMAVQLLALVAIHIRLGIRDRTRRTGSVICTQLPLSIYLGWISIASIANVSTYLVSIHWDGAGLSPENWTLIMIGAAVLLTLGMVWGRKNIFFGLVVLWALYGIAEKRQQVNASVYRDITVAAWLGMGIVALACLVQFVYNMKYKAPPITFPEAKLSLK